MNVFVANEQSVPVDEVRLSSIARHTLRAEKVEESAELSILLVGADHIRRLNKRFAGHDHATDVLSFPMMEDGDPDQMLGDVVICAEVAQRNAEEAGRSLTEEVDTLVVHGTLHLLGYDHQGPRDKQVMDQRLESILRSFAPTVA